MRRGDAVFNGVDARWSGGGVQVRGEWIFGHPFNRVDTRGGYIDLIVHRIGMGPLTAVARAERLDYDATTAARSLYLHRFTAGGRVRLGWCLSGVVNVVHQPSGLAAGRTTVLDAGLGCTVRR